MDVRDFDGEYSEYDDYYVKDRTLYFDNSFRDSFDYSILKDVESIHLPIYFNQPLPRLPNHIKSISFGHYFNQNINDLFDFENSLIEEISFGSGDYSSSLFDIDVEKFPPQLKRLYLYSNSSRILNLPDNLEILSITKEYENAFEKFPSNLKKVEFNREIKTHINNLPDSVEELVISRISVPILRLPLNLKKLKLETSFRTDMPPLPNGLEELEINCHFNKPFGLLPNSLKILLIDGRGYLYQYPIENLPNSIEFMLIFRTIISIDRFPDNLKELEIGGMTSKTLPALPLGVKKVTLGCDLNNLVLSDSVEYLTIHGKVFSKIERLPENLKEIVFPSGYDFEIDNLPYGVKKVNLYCFVKPIKNIPPTLEEINLGSKYNLCVSRFKEGLKKIFLGDKFNKPIDNLPDSVEEIVFSYYSKFKFENASKWPLSLRKLDLSKLNWNIPLLNLPSRIEKLTLPYHFNKRLNYPAGLKRLEFGLRFNQELGILPDGLKKLYFGDHFNQRLDNLPAGLKKLKLGMCFNQFLDNLPVGLEHLSLGKYSLSLDFLPSNLRFMRINVCQNRLDNLPDSLKVLELSEVNTDINLLPDSIEILKLNKIFGVIRRFPKNLKLFIFPRDQTINLPIGDYRVYEPTYNDYEITDDLYKKYYKPVS